MAGGFDFLLQADQLGAARLDFVQALACCCAECGHGVERAAIFALERFEKRDALFDTRQLGGIDVEAFGIALQGAGDIFQLPDRLGMRLRDAADGAVDFFEIVEGTLDFAKARDRGVVILFKALQDLHREFGEAAGICAQRVAREQRFLLAGLDGGAFDLTGLVLQELDFAL